MINACAVIPVYNHHHALPAVVAQLRAHALPVILVNDGSDAQTRQCIEALAADTAVHAIHMPCNRGKGAAVMRGIREADARGYTHALQVDADGQHDLADVPQFLQWAQTHPQALISGTPVYDESIPKVRFYGRYLTHVLVWFYTLSLTLRDSMCGFRMYPVKASCALMQQHVIGKRMDFDTDIMVRLYWQGTDVHFIPTRVHYPDDGVSHYRMLKDNVRMAWLHMRLAAGMIPRIPALLRRRRAGHDAHHWAAIAERGNRLGIRFISAVDRILGRRITACLLAPALIYFMLVHGEARRASTGFLRRVGLKPGFINRYRQWRSFADAVLDKAVAWQDIERLHIDTSRCQPLLQDLRAGKGVLLITAHMGNAEVARSLMQQVPELSINALVHSKNSVNVTRALSRMNRRYGLKLIQVSDMGPATAVTLKEKIDAGEVVVIAGDRVPVSSHAATVAVDFLGDEAPFAIGPYVLAHLLECPVYLLFCLKQQGTYTLYVEPFAEKIHLPRRERQASVQIWAEKYAARLAHYARKYPYQWYNFYDVWAQPDALIEQAKE